MDGMRSMESGEACMNIAGTAQSLYAAIHAAEFPAQALLRLRPDLQSKPVVILAGRAPEETVCAMNSHARKLGVTHAMSRLETEGLKGLYVMSRSEDTEAAAHGVMLECSAQFSPRIEEASQGTSCIFVLDITGTERLFGPPDKLAVRLRASLLGAGLRVSVVISRNFDVARMKAAAIRGVAVIPVGEEANVLSKISIEALGLPEQFIETFMVWGIRTLAELAALPEVELIARLGQQARMWRELARGMAGHTFQPIQSEFQLKEFVEFETHVEHMDSLLFIGANMIDSLAARAAGRALSLALLKVQMGLEGGLIYERALRPAIPSSDRKFLLKLLQLEIAAHPPQAAVVTLTLTAEAGKSSEVQLGLFAPETPESSRLDVTLARLKAIVGDDRVGSPVLEDTHHHGSFRMERFTVNSAVDESKQGRIRMALRRTRPPVPVRVHEHASRPIAFQDGSTKYEIAAAYGPWKTSGNWWSANVWDAEEWDVLATNGRETLCCLLVLDRIRNQWQIEALYD
jgi:protein ImuB